MSSVTTWTRLEPRPRVELQQRSLEARIHDPLWMLARQWQFGELNGEDAGSPIAARLLGSYSVLQRYYAGALPVADFKKVQPFAPGMPLETVVERERVHSNADVEQGFRCSYEAGLQFLRLLRPALAAKYRSAYRVAFPFEPLDDAQRKSFDEASIATWDLLAPRAINGRALYVELAKALNQPGGGALPASPAIQAADVAAVTAAAHRWLAAHDALFDEPAIENPAWLRERLEYRFAVSGDSASGEIVLSAAEYSEDHLDWSSFDLAATGATLRAPGEPVSVVSKAVESLTIPAPVRYKGMPVDRWWEFEDRRVNFGNVDAGPADLARMLMIEFAVIYGNDWFVIPVELPVGSLFKTGSLVITDTFGVRTLVPANLEKQTPGQSWRMFELSGADPKSNVFILPPALMDSLHAEPSEDVLFLRDEMANMAWAIERTIEGPTGDRVDRIADWQHREESARQQAEASQPLREEPDPTLLYRLSSTVPAPGSRWFPSRSMRPAKCGSAAAHC